MVSEKKMNLKRRWIKGLLLPALVLSIVGFVSFKDKTTAVKAESATGSPFIYDNGGLATGTTSNSGVTAPTGTQWSEVQNETGNTTFSNTLAGVSCSVTATVFRCADDFTIPAGQTWTIDQVVTFAYQTGFTGTTSPITGATLQIWSGRPGDSGSTIIFGNTTTNRLASSTDSSLFRIFNSSVPSPGTTPATNRRIWQNHIAVSPALVLTAGTYWVDWNTQIGATTAHFAPTVTIPGARTQPGWNGRQFTATGWVDTLDVGNPDASAPDVPQDYPFKLVGSVTGAPSSQQPNVDFDNDGKTDYSVIRDSSPAFSGNKGMLAAKSYRERIELMKSLPNKNAENLGGPPPVGTNISWFIFNSGNSSVTGLGHGDPLQDFAVPADFDGDGKADVAVWRGLSSGQPSGNAYFYILNSSTSTLQTVDFGQEGDNPTVSADYDGDGKADPAVYRCPTTAGQCNYYYLGSAGTGVTFVPWGNGTSFSVFPNVGDFDGDGKADFCIQRANPSAPTQAQFVLLRSSDFGAEFISWGLTTDVIAPGDFDGDGKSDFAVGRNDSGQRRWYILERDGGAQFGIPFGIASDYMTPGDYDGDGKTDIAIFRPDIADPNNNYFYVLRSSDGALATFEWGIGQDYPLANWQVQ